MSAGYFATLQAQLIRGRHFRETAIVSQPKVAIINQSLANQFFAGEDPIGKQIYYRSGSRKHPWRLSCC